MISSGLFVLPAIALERSRDGITWTNSETVYMALCLIGSKDERNFHLQVLMSIAQIIQPADL